MPHDFGNYVHLEGVVDNEPVVTPGRRGATVQFTMTVKESRKDANGALLGAKQSFLVEMTDGTGWILQLRKNTPVSVDGSLQNKTIRANGVEHRNGSVEGCPMIVQAHRIHTRPQDQW